VGREAELGMLEALLSASIEEEARAVVVKAPPGVGKSRLRHELIRRISARGDDILILVGRGDPLSSGTAYGLFGQALRRMAGIQGGEHLDVRREKLAKRIGERLPKETAARVVAFMGELSSVPFPDEYDVRLRAARRDPLLMSDQLTLAALDFLRAECAARPMLLVLEDLHWGDALTVKLCEIALHKLSGYPLMVLALARLEVDELFPEVWSGVAQVVILNPLSKKACERLVRQVLGERTSPETVARIVAQSEGNALFLEELIRAAAEGEASGTVLAMMQARIGRLPASARRVLRAASVFGETAGQGGIHALLGGSMSAQEIDGWLTRLLQEEVLEQWSESGSAGGKVYRFHHAQVRDAAYSLSSEEELVTWHRFAGEYLEAQGEPDSLVLAEHFVRGREPLRAAPHYLRAGEGSLETNDLAATLSSAEHGLACGAEGELRGALLSLAVEVYYYRDQPDKVVLLGTEAINLLPKGTPHCRSIRYVYSAAIMIQRMELLPDLLSRFARIEPRDDARAEYAEAAAWFTSALAAAGVKEQCRALQERAWQAGAAVGRNDLLMWGSLAAMDGCNDFLIEEIPWSSMTRFTEAVDAHRAVGEQRAMTLISAYLGGRLHYLGDRTGAEAILRESHAQAEHLGVALGLDLARTFLARLLAQTAPLDRLDEPEQLARDVIRGRGKYDVLTAITHGALAEIRRRQGDLALAEREARAACEAVRPFPPYAWELIALHARILLEQGRAEEALAVAEAGVRELERLGLEGSGEIALRLSLAEALHATGKTDAAYATLADILPRLKKRLDDIPEPAARERYLTNVPANARVVALAKAWLGEDAAVRGLTGVTARDRLGPP
jgi:hypothetical protein